MNDLSFADRVDDARAMLRKGFTHSAVTHKHGRVVLKEALFRIAVSRPEYPPQGREIARDRLKEFRDRVAAIVARRRECEAA